MLLQIIYVLPVLVVLVFVVRGIRDSRGLRGRMPKNAVKLATIASAYALEALLRALESAKIKYFLKQVVPRVTTQTTQVIHIQPSYGEMSVYVKPEDMAEATKILNSLNAAATRP